jgi:glutamyl-tRNA reductase
LIDHELVRFTRWLETLEVVPTISALQSRGEAIAKEVLAENRTAWQDLSDADRERLELLAATIVKRLLQQPILRLKARADEHVTYAYIQALRELFGLEPDTSVFGPAAAGERSPKAIPPDASSQVTPMRRRRAK